MFVDTQKSRFNDCLKNKNNSYEQTFVGWPVHKQRVFRFR